MPNPMFLQVMNVSIHEYNAYSPAKKARFQKIAQEKLITLHETDIDGYTALTAATAKSAIAEAKQAEADDAEDLENS
jgi:hypothetical protein